MKRTWTGGRRKGSPRGPPKEGSASPLLANLYMNRYLSTGVSAGRGNSFQARVISYADDFVILSRGHATEALTWTRSCDGTVWD